MSRTFGKASKRRLLNTGYKTKLPNDVKENNKGTLMISLNIKTTESILTGSSPPFYYRRVEDKSKIS